PIVNAVDWIARKRIRHHKDERVVGLFPAGFSAEHLGPNDYYLWDDFWGVAGLQAAALLLEGTAEEKPARAAREQAADFMGAIERSLKAAHRKLDLGGALPASPLRRM